MRGRTVNGPAFNPYEYTSGRWLRLDKEQRHARRVAFDFNKLCDRVIACSPGARDIVQCVKLEGGFNRAFVIGLDNGKSVVARVPFSAAGPARLTTHSEVATLEYSKLLLAYSIWTSADLSQSEDIHPSRSLRSSTGVMILLIPSAQSISSWNTLLEFDYKIGGLP